MNANRHGHRTWVAASAGLALLFWIGQEGFRSWESGRPAEVAKPVLAGTVAVPEANPADVVIVPERSITPPLPATRVYSIDVRFLDPEGAPVEILDPVYPPELDLGQETLVADADGYFRCSATPGERRPVREVRLLGCLAARVEPNVIQFDAADGIVRIDATLPGGPRVELHSKEQLPLTGIEVVYPGQWDREFAYVAYPAAIRIRKEASRFTVPLLEERTLGGKIPLWISAQGHAWMRVELDPGELRRVVRLDLGGELLVSCRGRPECGRLRSIEITGFRGLPMAVLSEATFLDGAVRLARFPPGPFSAEALFEAANPLRPARQVQTAAVVQNVRTELGFDLCNTEPIEPLARLRVELETTGIVGMLDPQNGVVRVEVTPVPKRRDQKLIFLWLPAALERAADDPYAWEVQNLRPGDWEVRLLPGNDPIERIHLEPGDFRTVRLQASGRARLDIHVVDVGTGAPLPEARVLWGLMEDPGVTHDIPFRAGHFVLIGEPRRAIYIQVNHGGYVPELAKNVALPQGATDRTFQLRLAPRIRILVEDEQAEPVAYPWGRLRIVEPGRDDVISGPGRVTQSQVTSTPARQDEERPVIGVWIVDVSEPGTYTIRLPETDDYSPVEPVPVTVVAGHLVDVTVRVRRKP